MKNELTELSKTTLGNYINKAGNSRIDIAKKRSDLESKHLKAGEKVWSPDKKVSDDAVKERKDLRDKSDKLQIKDIKRQFGIHKAVNRMTKESYESLGLLVQSIQEGNASNMSQLFDKVMSEKINNLIEDRKEYIVNELFNEEQIDELSKDTFKSYIKKAVKDSNLASRSAGYHGALSHSSSDDATKKSNAGWSNEGTKHKNKRSKGIDKALDRLTRESVEDSEQIDELSKKTLGDYIKKSSHNVATLGAVTRQLANDARDARQNDDYTIARKKSAQADSVFQKSWNRRKNMAKAIDRITKE